MGKTKRESNFELLRITAMMLIVIYHVFFHCINNQILSKDMFPRGEMFNNPVIYRRLAITEIVTSFGKIGNNLFIMLSGYFLIDKAIDVKKPIKKLLGEMFFVTVIFTICSYFYVINTGESSGITFRYFNSGWWFVGYYILIILIARFVLSRFMDRMGAKEHGTAIVVLFAIVSIKYIRNMLNDISSVLTLIVIGMLMYLIGGYIKLYNPLEKMKTVFLFLILLIVNAFMVLSYLIDNYNSLNGKNDAFYQKIYSYEEYAICCIIISVCLFELFRRMRLPHSRVINYIASASFMVYLIHDNPFSRNLFYKVEWVRMLFDQDYGYFFLMLGLVVLIAFAVGIIAYFIYEIVSKAVIKIVGSQLKL